MAPFVLPYDDDSENAANVSYLLSAPAGHDGYVHAGENGHLYSGEKRIRFFGMNLGTDANFPEHSIADKTAARLAKFGINSVRFHHMDYGWAPEKRNVFGVNPSSTLTADEESLDRLGYFVASLKKQGIYTNLNLLCSRRFTEADGLPKEIESLSAKDSHRVGFFYQPLIDLQKAFARQLLTYENPYTGMTFAKDPAVAIVEIHNENGLVAGWLSGYTGLLRDGPVPEVFEKDLERQWNQWLKEKYGSTKALKEAWGGSGQGDHLNLIANGDFSHGTKGWVLNTTSGAEASVAVIQDKFYGDIAQVDVSKPGPKSWNVEFFYPVKLTKGRGYRLKFSARSDRQGMTKARIQEMESPWKSTSLDQNITLKPYWQDFEFNFLAAHGDVRANFAGLSKSKDKYYFRNVSLEESLLDDKQSLEQSSISLKSSALSQFALDDWVAFLYDLERQYWKDMYDFLRNDIGYRSVIVGSQVGFSTPMLMAEQDVVDTHYYWQHPKFPGKAWDYDNWYVNNLSMVNDPRKEITRLAMQRVLGKPFLVTEYDHPAPSLYASEAPLIVSAYAALQDWDGFYFFLYQGKDEGWDSEMVKGFFDYAQHPTKMANMIIAANLFLRGDLSANNEVIEIPQSLSNERKLLTDKRPSLFSLGVEFYGMKPEQAIKHRVGLKPSENAHGIAAPLADEHSEKVASDTDEFIWDNTDPNGGVILIDTPKTKVLLGYGEGNRYDLGDVSILPGETIGGWQTIAVTSLDDRELLNSKRMLVVATGYVENTDMGWTDDKMNSVGSDWGKAPSRIEVVPAEIVFKHSEPIRVWSLDGRGERKALVDIHKEGANHYRFTIGEKHETLWYEIEAFTDKF
ncbi:carbohydrate binding domain-containing protein [Rubellicoccus peritrichatus]|uniref:Carbohydrate binding domain-containing protein n=1 Tax=Rubellicoccus peritrichatus TaxID=3080537 RepID=A0AAQ3QRQ9_9BACT|nr:carbohydrate binding domain-containing protein [Puniceicoccus sp. CR14]WOO41543.1 carbohydrate binding domain-containing protein [Puniceicoccus sp. CR14]